MLRIPNKFGRNLQILNLKLFLKHLFFSLKAFFGPNVFVFAKISIFEEFVV